MPPFETFKSAHPSWSTLAHKHAHSSGHRSRRDRDFGPPGTPEYAREELVAELGSAFLCAASSPRADHASYIGSWPKPLENQPLAVFDAASQAQHTVEFLHALHDGNTSGAARPECFPPCACRRFLRA